MEKAIQIVETGMKTAHSDLNPSRTSSRGSLSEFREQNVNHDRFLQSNYKEMGVFPNRQIPWNRNVAS